MLSAICEDCFYVHSVTFILRGMPDENKSLCSWKLSRQRQSDIKRTPFSQGTFCPNVTPMALDDLEANGWPQP
jgi:hypothetical protein